VQPELSVTLPIDDAMPEVDSGVRHPTLDIATARRRMGAAADGQSDADLRLMLDRLGVLGEGGTQEPRVDQARRVADVVGRHLGAEHPKARALAFAAKLVQDAAELRTLFDWFPELRSPEALNGLLQSALDEDRERGPLVPGGGDPTSPAAMRGLYVRRIASVDRDQEAAERMEVLMLFAGMTVGDGNG
jgi:hypothetical protein